MHKERSIRLGPKILTYEKTIKVNKISFSYKEGGHISHAMEFTQL